MNLNNLALVEYGKGNRKQGIDLLRQSLEMSRRVLGPEHPDLAARAITLAYWLVDAGQFAEAALLVDEGLAIRRKVLGLEHPSVAGALTVKANLLIATGHFGEARDMASEAERIIALSLPKDSWQMAAAMNTRGAALTKLGQYSEAEPLLLESRDRLGQSPIPNLAERGRERLVDLYTAWGKKDEARKYFRK